MMVTTVMAIAYGTEENLGIAGGGGGSQSV
jgi:hypothetical protein